MKKHVTILAFLSLYFLAACASTTTRHPEFGKDCSELAPGGLATNIDCVRVFYGTNRPITSLSEVIPANVEEDMTAALKGDSGRLNLGRADIWLPKLVSAGGTRERGETPMLKGKPPEDAKELSKYVFVTRITKNGKDNFVQSITNELDNRGGNGVLLFIHGFNVKFESALIRSAQLSVDLEQDGILNPGVPVLFSWPSAGKMSLGNYRKDGDLAADAVPHLKEFLDILTNDLDVKRVNIIAHSMGNRVLVGSLEAYARTYLENHPDADIEFRIILAAADVERDIFDQVAGKLETLDPNVTIYTSDDDLALTLSEIVNGEPRLGDTDKNKPYIRPVDGYETVDATPVASELFGIGHSYYSTNPFILGDIRCALANTPPDDRALDKRRYADQSNTPEYFRTDAEIEPFFEECSLVRNTTPNQDPNVAMHSASGSGRGVASPPPARTPSVIIPPVYERAPEPVIVAPAPMPPPPAPEMFRTEITLYFDTAAFDVNDGQSDTLLDLISSQGNYSSVYVISHTDTVGSQAANQQLSARRGEVIAARLTELGVDRSKILVEARGEHDLLKLTADNVAEPMNRRVQIIFVY